MRSERTAGLCAVCKHWCQRRLAEQARDEHFTFPAGITTADALYLFCLATLKPTIYSHLRWLVSRLATCIVDKLRSLRSTASCWTRLEHWNILRSHTLLKGIRSTVIFFFFTYFSNVWFDRAPRSITCIFQSIKILTIWLLAQDWNRLHAEYCCCNLFIMLYRSKRHVAWHITRSENIENFFVRFCILCSLLV